FSSRRRHTRSYGDWSSDVCSSDLLLRARKRPPPKDERDFFYLCEECGQAVDKRSVAQIFHHEEQSHVPLTEAELTQLMLVEMARSEERRIGKECRDGGWM